jgi:hypothetical protein
MRKRFSEVVKNMADEQRHAQRKCITLVQWQIKAYWRRPLRWRCRRGYSIVPGQGLESHDVDKCQILVAWERPRSPVKLFHDERNNWSILGRGLFCVRTEDFDRIIFTNRRCLSLQKSGWMFLLWSEGKRIDCHK